MSRIQYILDLERRIEKLIAERDNLEKENLELKRKLAFYEGPHTPPSHETLKKAEVEERNEPPKKRGAPVGHEGATRVHPEPDAIEHVSTRICPNCMLDPGEPTDTEEVTIEDTVQPPKIKVTKYILDVHDCQHCHHKFTTRHKDCPTKGRFGVNLLVYSTMLKFQMRGPLRKIEEFMLYHNDFKVSTKGVMDMHLRVGDVCKIEYDNMVLRIRAARWRHIDETSFKVNGMKFWLWIFRTNEGDVLVVIRDSRGSKVVKEILGEDHEGPDIVDGWTAYNFIKIIQRCWAHLLREVDTYKGVSEKGKRLSDDIHSMFDKLKGELNRNPSMDERTRLKEDHDRNIKALARRYRKFKELEKPVGYIRGGLGKWYTCFLYPGMEPTNNLGEQAMREHVIIRKIIGCFRSENGSQNYQYIASLLASWKLQGKNMFVELDALLRRELCLA